MARSPIRHHRRRYLIKLGQYLPPLQTPILIGKKIDPEEERDQDQDPTSTEDIEETVLRIEDKIIY